MRGRDSNPNVLTIKDVCDWLKVHPQTVYRLIRFHQFPAWRLGSDWRFNRAQIEEWALYQERAMTARRQPK
jgi:excisionase family DNA binding protein